MKKIKDNDYPELLFPTAFTLMCETYKVKNNLRFFFFCVHYLTIQDINPDLFLTKEKILDIYVASKKHVSAFSKLAKIYRFKKYKKYEYDSDMSFIPLKNYKEYEKIKIIQNKTVYQFKLKDLIHLWKISLNNSDNMFPLPKPLKNPFTNIEFEKHQLYNIYFKYGFGPNFMPDVITHFFKSNLNFHIFKMEYHEKLQINAINKYINKGSVIHLFDYLSMLLHDYRKELRYTFFKPDMSVFRKLNIIKNLEKYLKYYLYCKFILNPLRKEYYSNLIKKELKREIDLLHESYFITLSHEEILRYENPSEQTNDIEDDENEEEMDIDVESDDESTEILHSTTILNTNINQNNTTYRRSSYPRLFPPIISNTYENYNSSQNPFLPSNELPRTPNRGNNSQISSRFNLGLRR